MLEKDRAREMTMRPHRVAYVIRMRFARQGPVIYIGHLDMMRTFERVLRRAGLPIMHSQGYNPRPAMVFALPLGVGIATEDDYVDISFNERMAPQEVLNSFNAFAPDGLKALDAFAVKEDGPGLMSCVSAATYRLEAKGIFEAVESLFKFESIVVKKRSKKGMREVDIRPMLLSFDYVRATEEHAVIVTTCAGSSRNLRPDILLESLCAHVGYDSMDAANCQVVRVGLFTGEYPDVQSVAQC